MRSARPTVRIAVFLDGRWAPTFLRAVHRAAEARGDVIVAACPTGRPRPARGGVVDRGRALVDGPSTGDRIARVARRHGVPVLVPPPAGVGDPEFVDAVRRLRIELALSAGSLAIWPDELLGAVDRAVNHHDALLPAHAGLGATSFSILDGDRESGFTFHDMVPEIDAGPILLQGSVPVRPEDDLAAVVARKREAAVAAIPELLERVARGEPGRPQVGVRTYHSNEDRRRAKTVLDPAATTVRELEQRLRAFGWLHVQLGGRLEPVTAISTRPGPGRLRIELADGVRHATALAGHRVLPYRLARRLSGR